jgi:hypothetical protein
MLTRLDADAVVVALAVTDADSFLTMPSDADVVALAVTDAPRFLVMRTADAVDAETERLAANLSVLPRAGATEALAEMLLARPLKSPLRPLRTTLFNGVTLRSIAHSRTELSEGDCE